MRKRGEDLPQAKLKELDILEIREAWEIRERAIRHYKDTECFSMESLGKKYGTCKSNIEKIVNYYTWSHL